MILSLHSPPKKTKIVYFRSCARVWASNVPATGCTYAFFVSVLLVVPQLVGVRVLNQLTNCSIRFNSCSYASLPGETTPVFNHFKSPCWSEKQKVSSRVINLVKKTHTKLSRQNISPEKFLCIVRSTQSTQHVKCSTCFLGLFCHPWRNIHQMTHRLEASHQLRKRDRKDAENFPFNGLWDAVFTAFGCNLSGDDFHLFTIFFSGAQHRSVCSRSC